MGTPSPASGDERSQHNASPAFRRFFRGGAVVLRPSALGLGRPSEDREEFLTEPVTKGILVSIPRPTPEELRDPLDRRNFLRLLLAAGVAGGCARPGRAAGYSRRRSAFQGKVIRYHDDALLRSTGDLDPAVVKKALDDSLGALYHARRGAEVWGRLFSPRDTVGVKVNCLAGRPLSTDPALVHAVVEGVQSAGVKPENIVIFDMKDADLAKGGFEYNRGGKGVQCYGTNSDYDSLLTRQGKVVTNLSKILSTTCTVVVNLCLLKDHVYAGVSAAMKNHFGCINHPWKYHFPKGGDPFVADTYAIPQIHGKERLVICEAARMCYDGGPSPSPARLAQCVSYPKALLVSKDAVALDYVAYCMIRDERKQRNLPSLKEEGRLPKYIVTAARYGLGLRNLRKTRIIELPEV